MEFQRKFDELTAKFSEAPDDATIAEIFALAESMTEAEFRSLPQESQRDGYEGAKHEIQEAQVAERNCVALWNALWTAAGLDT